MILKPLYILFGTISLGVGIIGIAVPGLPTTPFLLLTAWLYHRSTKRLYGKLLNSQVLGPYIKNFIVGMDKKKIFISITIMWLMILISTFIFIENWYVRIILLLVGVIGTIGMSLFSLMNTKSNYLQNEN